MEAKCNENLTDINVLGSIFFCYFSELLIKDGRKIIMSDDLCFLFYKFAANIKNLLPMAKDINRIKVVLVEQKRTGKWLAEQMGKDQATVSKWCTNTSQPDLPTLTKVAEILNVDIKELLNSTKDT